MAREREQWGGRGRHRQSGEGVGGNDGVGRVWAVPMEWGRLHQFLRISVILRMIQNNYMFEGTCI